MLLDEEIIGGSGFSCEGIRPHQLCYDSSARRPGDTVEEKPFRRKA